MHRHAYTLALCLILNACNDSTGPGGPQVDISPMDIQSASFDSLSNTGVFMVTEEVIRDPRFQRKEFQQISANLFARDSAANCFGGTVTVNGYPIPAFTKNSGTYYHAYSTQIAGSALPIGMDGRQYIFKTTGFASCFPAFEDTIIAPTVQTLITSPSPGDTVSRSAGLVVQWNAAAGRSIVKIVDDQASEILVRDVGTSSSLALGPGELSALPDGYVRVAVTRFRTLLDSAGGIGRALSVGSGDAVVVTLGP